MPTRISASLCDPRTFHTRCQFRQSYQLAPLGIILLSHWSGTGLRATLLSWRAKRIARKCASDCTKPREAKNKDSLPRSVKDFYNCFAQIDEAKYHWLRNDSRSIDSFLPSLSPPPPPLPNRVFFHVRLTRDFSQLPQKKSLVADYSGTKLPSLAAHLVWYHDSSPPQLHKTTWITISSKKMLQQCLSIVTQHGVTCHMTVSWKNSLDDFFSGVYEAAASGKFTIVKTVAVGVWKKLIYLISACCFVTTQHWFV